MLMVLVSVFLEFPFTICGGLREAKSQMKGIENGFFLFFFFLLF